MEEGDENSGMVSVEGKRLRWDIWCVRWFGKEDAGFLSGLTPVFP